MKNVVFGPPSANTPSAMATINILRLIEDPDVSPYVWANGEISLSPAFTDNLSHNAPDTEYDFSRDQIHGIPLPREFPIGEFMHQSSATSLPGLIIPLCLVGLQPIGKEAITAVGDNATSAIRITVSLGIIQHLMVVPTVDWLTAEGESFCPDVAHDIIAVFAVPRTRPSVRAAHNGNYAAFVEPNRMQDRLFVLHFSGPEHRKCVYRFDEWVTRIQPERRRQVQMTFLIQSPSPLMSKSFIGNTKAEPKSNLVPSVAAPSPK